MALDVGASPFFKRRKLNNQIVVEEPPTLDLESYIANYDGRTRIERLVTIAQTSTFLSVRAIRAAIIEAKQGKDTALYLKLADLYKSIAPSEKDIEPDLGWVDMKNKQVQAETEKLESELRQYKNNMIKESIRMTSEELGLHYLNSGDFFQASKAFQRARDYCTTGKHIVELSTLLTITSAAQRIWIPVLNQVTRVQAMLLKAEDKTKLGPAMTSLTGLAYLQQGKYNQAAQSLTTTSPTYLTPPDLKELTAGINFQRQIISPNDVAIYGALTALATMDRITLRMRALDSDGSFRPFLELEPQMRKCIKLFYNGKYAACLQELESHRVDWLCDMYLQPHIDVLLAKIRQECIILYWNPFTCVRLDTMEKVFGRRRLDRATSSKANESGKIEMDGGYWDPNAIEPELIEMIKRGVLDARIDIVDRQLIRPIRNPRAELVDRAIESAQRYEHQLHLRLTRTAMIQAGLIVKRHRDPAGVAPSPSQNQQLLLSPVQQSLGVFSENGGGSTANGSLAAMLATDSFEQERLEQNRVDGANGAGSSAEVDMG